MTLNYQRIFLDDIVAHAKKNNGIMAIFIDFDGDNCRKKNIHTCPSGGEIEREIIET